MIPHGLLLLACWLPGQAAGGEGRIDGAVRNGSRHAAPCQATVILRVQVEGRVGVLREVPTDEWGHFVFERLPLGEEYEYMPGANRDGVHYPGSRVRLTPERPQSTTILTVYDSIEEPNPLILRQQHITVEPAEGSLKVTEALWIDNPSDVCYVGRSAREGGDPLTLHLGIPADFQKITFDEEFLGRRFAVVDGRLATGIPWPPGKKEVRFTYVLRNTQRQRVWQRPLDLPCAELRLRVPGAKPDDVRCSLGAPGAEHDGTLLFQAAHRTLPAGYVVYLELGHLPVPWIDYARWLSPLALLGLVGTASWAIARRRRPHP